MTAQTEPSIKEFILDSYLFGDDSRMPGDTDSLLETGVLDSTGVLELIEFLEMEFGITVEDNETVPENLGSIAGITRFVAAKRGRGEGVA